VGPVDLTGRRNDNQGLVGEYERKRIEPAAQAIACCAMPSIKPPSPSSSRSSSSPRTHSPTEVTTLLPASSSHTPSLTFVRNHNRKASVSGRSVNGRNVAGSVRGYGAVTRPGPVEQAPRVSRAGQRVGGCSR
jgi:hypothetical protein